MCKHCGYRFAHSPLDTPQGQPRGPVCRFSAFMRVKGALAGEFGILSGDPLALLEFGAAASEFISSRGGSVAG